jgi:glycerol-3-phosphate cytidylyltransferase
MSRVIGITCSTFDLFHPGHIKMLEEAKLHCDYLIAALQTDPTIDRPTKNKPIQSVVERYIQLDSCKLIDKIVPYETEKDLEDIFSSFDINIRIIGEEYRDKEFTARGICEKRGIKIIFNTRDHGFSSTELRNRIYDEENKLRYKVAKNEIPS